MLEKFLSPVRHYNYERLELCSLPAEEGEEQQSKTLNPSICRRHDQELRWTRWALLFFVLSTIFLLVAYMLKTPSDLACARQTSIWCKFIWNRSLIPGLETELTNRKKLQLMLRLNTRRWILTMTLRTTQFIAGRRLRRWKTRGRDCGNVNTIYGWGDSEGKIDLLIVL
jgi:hypothetical protein